MEVRVFPSITGVSTLSVDLGAESVKVRVKSASRQNSCPGQKGLVGRPAY
ncbi:hypothetical protein [Kitasatospora terrestris]